MIYDECIRMAREAGFNKNELALMGNYFVRLCKLAAEAERGACAKVCETEADSPSCLWEEPGCWQHAAENCAGAIRARGNA